MGPGCEGTVLAAQACSCLEDRAAAQLCQNILLKGEVALWASTRPSRSSGIVQSLYYMDKRTSFLYMSGGCLQLHLWLDCSVS